MSITLSAELARPCPPAQRARWAVRGASYEVFAACILACLVYLWLPATMNDPDIWWHLRNAEMQLNSHSFLTRDLYSFTTAGSPWINHEWLSELPFYIGWCLLGARGVYLVTLLSVEAIMLGVFYLSYKACRNATAALLVSVVGTILSTVSFGPRTLLFGWICLVLELILLEHITTDDRHIWMLPCLFVVWVNLHGSWVIGLVVLCVFVACACIRPQAVATEMCGWPRAMRWPMIASCGASIAALFINPYGWRLVFYPFDLAFRQRLNIENVEEWRSLDLHSPRGKLFLLSLAVMFFMQILKPRRWAVHELIFCGIGVYAAFTYSRFLFLAAILVMPSLAKQFGMAVTVGKKKVAPWPQIALLAAALPLLVQHFPSKGSMLAAENAYPRQALPFLQSLLPQGAMFHEYLWGGFLEWNARQIPVFIDSRVDIFEYNGTFRDYLDIIRLHDSLSLLDKYKIRYVLFEEKAPLSYLLEHTGSWTVRYRDGTTILFERGQP